MRLIDLTVRRKFLLAAVASLALPGVARSQGRQYRIAIIIVPPRRTGLGGPSALEQGLRDLGYSLGKDVLVEVHSAEGRVERLPTLVEDVVRSKPDVIVTGLNAVTTLVKAATQTIPIVFTVGTDVIRASYVQSFARPGGNITGITWDVDGGPELKRLDLLKEMIPTISHVAVLWEAPYRELQQQGIDATAKALRLRTFWHELSDDLGRDFAEITKLRADGLVVLGGARAFIRRAEIAQLAVVNRLPGAFSVAEFVDSGGLMSYGPSIAGASRAAARQIDKILKGVKPSDIPVERPTVFDLTINLKTARELGLKIPVGVLIRANRVIE